ncbi:MAG: 50S ribosomal protein L3 N(5)-glutamine methyltransferase [Betaproteobacteria bacterium]
MPPATTVRTLIERAAARLARARLTYGHGIPTAWDEAAYLALHVLKLPPALLTPYLDRVVTPRNAARVAALVSERIRRRVPVAYLTSEAWLGEHRFYVDARVLVPRSYIAELLQERIAPWLPRRPLRRALDLCTGSGCLAIVLAKTFAGTQIDAVDIDRGALAVARRNVADYRLQRRICLLHSDMFGAVRGERYDLIVANPPYVSADTMRRLPREYRHEPALALASGQDGLDAVHVILREAAAHLTKKGLLVVEVGHHRRRVERVFARHPFIWPQTSGGDDCVFILGRDDLVRAAEPTVRSPAPSRVTAPRRASRANAASRRR